MQGQMINWEKKTKQEEFSGKSLSYLITRQQVKECGHHLFTFKTIFSSL